jgi:hypothetical protein
MLGLPRLISFSSAFPSSTRREEGNLIKRKDQTMRCLITSVAGIGLSVGAGVPLALADGNTSPGNNAVFASKSSVSLPGCSRTAILTATIKIGKSNHVLMVQAMMLFEGQLPPVTGPAVIDASPTVNGIGMEPEAGPTHFSMTQQCPANVTFCTVSGVFWLDLDVAEAAHKGMFLGKPLNITLSGEACNGGGGAITHATLTGQLLAK